MRRSTTRPVTIFVLLVTLSGCTSDSGPTVPTTSEPQVEVIEGSFDVAPSTTALGSSQTLFSAPLMSTRPAGFTGLVVEARPDVAAYPPALVHRFSLFHDGRILVDASTADDRGIYRLVLTPADWDGGRIDLDYSAEHGDRPYASAARRVEWRAIVFAHGAPDWNATGFETAPREP